MDIDDILASVSAPRIPQRTLDLQALVRAWVAERTAPEVLPWPEELVARVMERVRLQVCLGLISFYLRIERKEERGGKERRGWECKRGMRRGL